MDESGIGLPPIGDEPADAGRLEAARIARWRRVGLAIAIVGLVLLIAAVAGAAWAPNENSSYPPMPLGDGLQTMAVVVGFDSAFLLAGAAVVAQGRRFVSPVIGGGLLLIAGFLGFFAAVMVNFGRCTTCDDA